MKGTTRLVQRRQKGFSADDIRIHFAAKKCEGNYRPSGSEEKRSLKWRPQTERPQTRVSLYGYSAKIETIDEKIFDPRNVWWPSSTRSCGPSALKIRRRVSW